MNQETSARNIGKSRSGRRPPLFTPEQAARIYQLHTRDKMSMIQLAKRFGSSVATIRKAIRSQVSL
jgi:hypothetical protein